jgi:hypothetical protein
MAYESVNPKSIIAGADLRSYQLRFVRLDTNGRLALAAAAGDAVGVLQDKPNLGDPGAVSRDGDFTKVVAGGVIYAGEYVQVGTDGKAVATTTGVDSLGQAMMAAGADGDVITILQQHSAIS